MVLQNGAGSKLFSHFNTRGTQCHHTFTIDMYLPAFPRIAASFNTSIERVAFRIYLFPGIFIRANYLWSCWTALEEKPPLYAGLLLCIIATIGCFTCNSIEALLVVRFIQALGGLRGIGGSHGHGKDFFRCTKASVISLLVLILGFIAIAGTHDGQFYCGLVGLAFCFIMLAVITFIILVVVFSFCPKDTSW